MKYLRKLTDVDTWLYISLWLFIGGTIYLMIALFHDSNQLTIKEIIEQKPITTTVTVTSQTIESHLDLRIGHEDPTDIEGIEQMQSKTEISSNSNEKLTIGRSKRKLP